MKTGNLAASTRGTAFPTGVRYVAIPARSIPTVVRWSFLLFVFTFPLDNVDLGFMSGMLSIPKISGYLFFAFYLLYYNPFFNGRAFPRIPHAMWWFLAYAAVFALNGFFVSEEFVGDFFTRSLTLMQLVVFFWIASDLLKDKKIARRVLLTYVIASVLLALGIILKISGFYAELEPGRAIALGENPNVLAENTAVAVVILVGLRLYTSYKHFMSKILLLVLTLPLLAAMVATGSRGGVLAFMTGCVVYLLPYWRSKRTLTAIFFVMLGIVTVVYMIASDPEFLERWQTTYYEGSLAGREKIMPAAIEMALERPIFGWQPVAFLYELGFRSYGIWGQMDAHNLYLHLLMEVGLVGAIPFLVGLWLCGWSAWRARLGDLGLLPLALLFTVLASGMSGTTLVWKTQWLVLALTLAAASAVPGGWGKRSAALLIGRPLKSGMQRFS